MSMVIGLVIVLGVLIFFHELGHFLVAKAFGVGVERFSLGFGPKLATKKVGRTEYCISALPLGGYVKMVGEQPDAEIAPEDLEFSFTHKPVWQRMLVVAAGPVFNFMLCILIFFGIFSTTGVMSMKPVIGEVKADTPARAAGLKSGDTIVAAEGEAIKTWSEMAKVIADSQGNPVSFTIQREGRRIEKTVKPEKDTVEDIFGETRERYMIGVSAAGETLAQRLNPISAMGESLSRTYLIIKLTVVSVLKLIQGALSVETLGGPIMIAQMAGEQFQHGAVNLLSFIALVSVNLGILNLLPVPVLDGGHLMFFSIEAVTGRPVSLRAREIATQIGIFLLMLLMVFVFYNDIMRIVSE
ncbi:MAG: RIP metalloprotease RseP [Desulfobacterales bacterium]|nr:RIP metalloprotease RseP [Desulfobacterales bacterium]